MHPTDPALPVVFGRRTATGRGLTPRQVIRRAEVRWDRLHRGQYTASELDEHDRWRAQVLAVTRSQGRDLVLSHASAARAWALPAPIGGWGVTTFTCAAGSRRRSATHVIRVTPLAEGDVRLLGRVAVTAVARTVVDCARTLPGRDALALADRALRLQLVTQAELHEAVDAQKGWPGAVRARLVVGLADGRRETPLESWSAWAFAEQGLPSPRWQVTVLDADGVFVGRLDALWREGVAGEADGQAKYLLGAGRVAAGEEPGGEARAVVAAVHAERRRETALRRTGLAVVRWGAVDVLDPRRAAFLAEHVRRETAAPRVVTARLVEL